MQKNKVLSWLHYIVTVIVVFDLIYILNYTLDLSKDNASDLIANMMGKLLLITLHIIAAKKVKNGRIKDRIFSLFMTLFVLSAFPIGSILATIMLIYIFKWQANETISNNVKN